jgi:hypothetical protein
LRRAGLIALLPHKALNQIETKFIISTLARLFANIMLNKMRGFASHFVQRFVRLHPQLCKDASATPRTSHNCGFAKFQKKFLRFAQIFFVTSQTRRTVVCRFTSCHARLSGFYSGTYLFLFAIPLTNSGTFLWAFVYTLSREFANKVLVIR